MTGTVVALRPHRGGDAPVRDVAALAVAADVLLDMAGAASAVQQPGAVSAVFAQSRMEAALAGLQEVLAEQIGVYS